MEGSWVWEKLTFGLKTSESGCFFEISKQLKIQKKQPLSLVFSPKVNFSHTQLPSIALKCYPTITSLPHYTKDRGKSWCHMRQVPKMVQNTQFWSTSAHISLNGWAISQKNGSKLPEVTLKNMRATYKMNQHHSKNSNVWKLKLNFEKLNFWLIFAQILVV